ncbi:hypothetical protein SOASR030_35460 [Leminorella grimontii]|uniref:Uncharacterized protein n=1 Tax=Leminorella grimontii TaxID=82981 RepID=A0AAV5N8V1_9GAMM|nr:hypothetical protein [Leminorella grimontii]KFC94401.1 hypothetical protein GLGR_2748 [Leminorella grimontii ATCC 33999 = DSM 5078]GKX57434.1 hypothetical protein SOASR030_35460 [Leminorella grimontii]VFS54617.1 Uncharacterised protein [Leminorella grimontii]
MSNDVYGYLEPTLGMNEAALLKEYIKNSSLNIQSITEKELFNYPSEFIPTKELFIFDIADGPNSINATYLIDYLEYDPESCDIGFPSDPKKRLNILLDTLVDMIKITNAKKMVVAMTDCNQIETIKKINLSELYDVIHADFEKYRAPPDTLYEITV